MPEHLPYISSSPFAIISSSLFEIAKLEHHYRNHKSLYRAPKMECSKFEYRFLMIDEIMRGLQNATFRLNIALSLIYQFPSEEYMSQYHYSAKSYALYHYSVICYNLSTIRDLYRKLVNQVCEFDIKSNKNSISWKELEFKLQRNKMFDEILQTLNKFQTSFGTYILDRQHCSHDGLIYNNIFSDMYLTDMWTDVMNGEILDNEHLQYMKGTKENQSLMKHCKQDYIDLLSGIILNVYKNTSSLLQALEPILLNDLESILSTNIKCWYKVPANTFDNISDYLNEIIKTQVQVYWNNNNVSSN